MVPVAVVYLTTVFRLREKQKVRRIYGVLKSNSVITTKKRHVLKGNTGENLLQLLRTAS